jgi:hypothetical protein
MVKVLDSIKQWMGSKKEKKSKKEEEQQDVQDNEIREEPTREPKKKEGFESKVKHFFHSDSNKGKTTSVPPP